MKHLLTNFILLAILALVVSCRPQEPVAYFSTVEREQAARVLNDYTAVIHEGDQIHIAVMSEVAEAVLPFNMETNRSVEIGGSQVNPMSSGYVIPYTYTVKKDGTIPYPILGNLKVEGMTPEQLNSYLQQRLRDEGYVRDATVDTRIMNFRVTVLGEVARPAMYHVVGERLTVLEALALAGDMTIYGQRNNVKIIRTKHGEQTIQELDLTSRDFLDSPFYYLQPNDIVYVEPNRIKKKSATYDPDTYSKVNIVARSVQVLTSGVGRIMIETNR